LEVIKTEEIIELDEIDRNPIGLLWLGERLLKLFPVNACPPDQKPGRLLPIQQTHTIASADPES